MQDDVAAIVAGLTKGERQMLTRRHSEAGNPWPFISITERSGGSKARMFIKMQAAGLYDRGNCLTDTGLRVRAALIARGVGE